MVAITSRIAPLNPLPNLVQVIKQLTLDEVRTCVPGFVVSYNPEVQRATIQIAVKVEDRLEHVTEYRKQTQLIEVPVYVYGSNNYAIEVGLNKDDEGLVVFTKPDIESWVLSLAGQCVEPTVPGVFDLSDAVFFPGFRPEVKSLWDFRNNGLRLRDPSGLYYIWLKEQDTEVEAESEILTHGLNTLISSDLLTSITSPTIKAEAAKTITQNETWNAGGYILENLTNAVQAQDAVTFKQMKDYHDVTPAPPKPHNHLSITFTDTTTLRLGHKIGNAIGLNFHFAIGNTIGHCVIWPQSVHTTLTSESVVHSVSMSVANNYELTLTTAGLTRLHYAISPIYKEKSMIFDDDETTVHTLTDGGHTIADSLKVFGIHFVSSIGANSTAGRILVFYSDHAWQTSVVLYSDSQPFEQFEYSVSSHLGILYLTIAGTGAGDEVEFTYSINQPLGVFT